ncbi:zinc finger CCCH domain-containing protein 15-like [Argiope bruennichi]|uniref:Zinc finger CCCH domain-containing protein 15 n=1 Tax=Argiope bruennichi TaxID=94029 RepID=A0A8T0FXW9_ARGBR|nr:zinc finger CCCH domain-containing protein 15-like [Argiope bruennichi]KAF8793673.1 Zinc finger CCCH domain-containing protein 15 [Argiope bruennichi]
MPPKAKPSKKAEIKKQEKIIEDKTFGLKNKKGAKNQKFIQQVQNQVKHGNQKASKAAELAKPGDKKKDDKKKEIDELALFRPVTVQKVEKGADPKSVLCAFYKQGTCTKGDKCKFSHDLTIERKSEKRNVYVDMRDQEEDGMENWDEAKLMEVVEKKHGESDRKMPKTDIICKYFLDALENNKYGWFWECPNGANKCHYRHALPPGFVLKKDKKKEEKTEQISIEDLVERQRAQLGNNLTRITYESFQLWKKKKLQEKQEKNRKEEDRKRAEFRAGRHVGLSGRDMFTFNPEMATDDQTEEGEAAFDVISREQDEETGPCLDISTEFLTANVTDVTGATVATKRHWEVNQEEQAVGGSESVEEPKDAVPIDENLFDEDLDELEDELENLSVSD